MLKQYFQDIYKTYKSREATESSYYPDLKKLLVSFLESKGIDPTITVQPKKTEAGIPDFTARKGMQLIGYVEAKDIGADLDQLEDSEQLKRYKENLPNFIFTNYFDFWLWRRDGLDEKKGQWIKKVRIAMPNDLKLKTVPIPQTQKEKEFFELLEAFFSFYIPERRTAKSLAKELADRAKLIHPEIVYLLNDEKEEEIDRIYNAFKKYLISDLKKEDFADIYAQTITYGLFTARLQYKDGRDFDRFKAQRYIPQNIKILKDTFSLISSQELPEAITPYVDDIATVLAYADIEKIREDLHLKRGDDDPLIHFYETFLAEYSPETRKARGVYYTPLPVVSYITRSINILLKEKFGKKEGFASEGVTLLDPAAGTLTFPASAIRLAKDEIEKSDIAGSWNKIIQNHILKDFYAFELLMAPYIIGHLKISLLLEDIGYEPNQEDRVPLYLTNTLDFKKHEQSNLPGFPHALTEESKKALEVKERTSIMVVVGNPPYSGTSTNISDWILEKIKDYKRVDGKPLGERNPKWLQDDYVKFFRFAQWKIDQAGQGILGFITNHAWLDNPTFRGMRSSILNTFDEIYIINLHGNSLKKETTPKGEKDENVFDIRAGVAITLCIKHGRAVKAKKVLYEDQWGLREEKYDWLEKNDIATTKWQQLPSASPNYLFVRQNTEGLKEWEGFPKITEVFPLNSVGIVTARDKFVIDENRRSLEARIDMFRSGKMDEYSIELYNLKDKPSFHWYSNKAREKLQSTKNWQEHFTRILYRPFDERWIYYHPALVERSREVVMKHMLHPNLALITHKREELNIPYAHFLVTKGISEHGCLSSKTTSYQFPLYVYNDDKRGQRDMFQAPAKVEEKKPNINLKVFDKLKSAFGKKPTPEEIFYYIYAVFYSSVYRKKYNEFLKIDFPRVPFTKDKKLFDQLSKLGGELVELHLMKSDKLEKSPARFAGDGMNLVEKPRYEEKESRVYINTAQYFEGISPEIWNYYIGGYQVLEKWLKDRKGRYLNTEELKHYLKIIAAISKTIKIQKEIDKLYLEVEKSLINL